MTEFARSDDARPPERPRRPDESMSLLVDIASQALDPAYAEAAARRGRDGTATPGRARPAVVLAGVLAATLVIVVAGVQAHRHAPSLDRTRQSLVGQVERRTDGVAALQKRLDRLRATTSALRTEALASTAAGAGLAEQLSTLELVAGTVAASGPGLRVVVDDAADGRDGGNRVTDHDLQTLVNALWAAGAEAVAVGSQRLTAESAIRQAGSSVLVNFEPVHGPYVIAALGDPVELETSFGTSRAAARMRTYTQLYGLGFHYSRSSDLTVPPAPGLTLNHAEVAPDRGSEGGP
jgi:uncharacterized protein YlxW (UPF0749 family)